MLCNYVALYCLVAMDVSADLTELGRTAVAVVCAGAKSILDIGRTLEVLETQGVCVATFGEDDDFPAFFTRRSGHKACNLETSCAAAPGTACVCASVCASGSNTH